MKNRNILKRMLALTLILSMLAFIALSSSASKDFADDYSNIYAEYATYSLCLTDEQLAGIEEMLSLGIPYEQARNIIKIDILLEVLEKNNQYLDLIDGRVVLLNGPDGSNVLTKEDTHFLVNIFQTHVDDVISAKENAELLTEEQALSKLEELMDDSLAERMSDDVKGFGDGCFEIIHSVDMGAGRIMTLRSEVEFIDVGINECEESFWARYYASEGLIPDGSITSRNGIVPSNIGDHEIQYGPAISIPPNSVGNARHTLSQSNQVMSYSAFINVRIASTNNGWTTTMSYISSGASAWGTMSIVQWSGDVITPVTCGIDGIPQIWTRARTTATFHASAAVTISLPGISFDVGANRTFTIWPAIVASISSIRLLSGTFG